MSGRAAHLRQRLSPEYGAALDVVAEILPAEAKVIRAYVSAVNSEAAAWRTEAHEFRCLLSAESLASRQEHRA